MNVRVILTRLRQARVRLDQSIAEAVRTVEMLEALEADLEGADPALNLDPAQTNIWERPG